MNKIAVTLIVLSLASSLPAQSARWVYTYDGPAHQWDQAWQVRCGPDSGVYVCGFGQANAIPQTFEMTVAGLTNAGDERWVYRYGSRFGQAYSLALTPDRNIVVAGTTWDSAAAKDFSVLGVSDSGAGRWAYHVDSGVGIARAITCDLAGNVYACGATRDYQSFTVASLTPAGVERWLWAPPDVPGEALAIALDPSGPVYAAGYMADEPDSTLSFSVWQLMMPDSASGVIYGGSSGDAAVAVSVGKDGNIYAAGNMDNGSTGQDFAVASMSTNPFSDRWLVAYDYAGGKDHAQAMLCGNDGNIYVAGYGSLPESAGVAFIVLSVTRDGDLRWIFADTGTHAAALNVAAGLAQDASGNIYACGQLAGSESTRMDAAVISLTPGGAERWRYLYAGPDTVGDNFASIVLGPDGNLYACGTTGDPPNADWLVVSLSDDGTGVELRTPRTELPAHAATFFRDRITVQLSPALTRRLRVQLLDAAGRTIMKQFLSPHDGYVTLDSPGLASLAPGCYFLDLGQGRSRLKLVKP